MQEITLTSQLNLNINYLSSLLNPIEKPTIEVITAKISHITKIKKATSNTLPSTPKNTFEIYNISVFNKVASDIE